MYAWTFILLCELYFYEVHLFYIYKNCLDSVSWSLTRFSLSLRCCTAQVLGWIIMNSGKCFSVGHITMQCSKIKRRVTIVCGGDVVNSRTNEFWGYSRVTPTELCCCIKGQGTTTTTPRMTVWMTMTKTQINRQWHCHGSKYVCNSTNHHTVTWPPPLIPHNSQNTNHNLGCLCRLFS